MRPLSQQVESNGVSYHIFFFSFIQAFPYLNNATEGQSLREGEIGMYIPLLPPASPTRPQ